jgi:hypothetical protein
LYARHGVTPLYAFGYDLVTADRRLLGHDEAHEKWHVAAGQYSVKLGRSATDLLNAASATVAGATFND